MNYYLFKLRFDTAVHFGTSDSALTLSSAEAHFCADTLFSALCHSAVSLYGSSAADRLCDDVRAGKLVLSDGMPWKGDSFYIPKPYLNSEIALDVPETLRKKMKKLRWIAIDTFGSFFSSIRGEQIYEPEDDRFGVREEHTKVQIKEMVAVPYPIGVFRFFDNCGLYFIAGTNDEASAKHLHTLLTGIGLSGFGGRGSTGYGRFQVVEMIDLSKSEKPEHLFWQNALSAESGRYILLTTSMPDDAEWEETLHNAQYQVTRRGGFAHTESTPHAFKKRTQYFLSAGSVLTRRFRGALFAVGSKPTDRVFRYSVPIMLGVDL